MGTDQIAFSNDIEDRLRQIAEERRIKNQRKTNFAAAARNDNKEAQKVIVEIDNDMARLDKEESLLRSAQKIDPIAFSNETATRLRQIVDERRIKEQHKDGLALAALHGSEDAQKGIAEIEEVLARLDKEQNLLQSVLQQARVAAAKVTESRAYANKAAKAKAAIKTIEKIWAKSREADAALAAFVQTLNERRALSNELLAFGFHTQDMQAVGRLSHPEAIRCALKKAGFAQYAPELFGCSDVSLEDGDRAVIRSGPDLLNLAKDA